MEIDFNHLVTLIFFIKLMCIAFINIAFGFLFAIVAYVSQFKKEGKDQETIQSSTTPDPGYQWENNTLTIRYYKPEPRGQQ